jgi:hypothetical protein
MHQTQEVVLTEEEVSVVAVAVLTEAVVAAAVEEAGFTGVEEAVVVVPAQAGVVALPEADLTNRPLTRGLIAKHRQRACGIINHAVPLDSN